MTNKRENRYGIKSLEFVLYQTKRRMSCDTHQIILHINLINLFVIGDSEPIPSTWGKLILKFFYLTRGLFKSVLGRCFNYTTDLPY